MMLFDGVRKPILFSAGSIVASFERELEVADDVDPPTRDSVQAEMAVAIAGAEPLDGYGRPTVSVESVEGGQDGPLGSFPGRTNEAQARARARAEAKIDRGLSKSSSAYHTTLPGEVDGIFNPPIDGDAPTGGTGANGLPEGDFDPVVPCDEDTEGMERHDINAASAASVEIPSGPTFEDALDEAMDPDNKVDDKADAGLGDGNDFGGGSFVDTGAKGSLQPGSV